MTFARRIWSTFGLGGCVEVNVDDSIPPHMGLGSGTKLGLAIARGLAGLAGISAGPEQLAEASVSRLLVTALLPGLLAGDIDEFGAALTQIQREVGSIFAAQQGGIFHPRAAPLVDALHALGVGAVGQSSWGPSVYGIVDGPALAADVADRLRAEAGPGTDVSVVDFDRRGARIARGAGRAVA